MKKILKGMPLSPLTFCHLLAVWIGLISSFLAELPCLCAEEQEAEDRKNGKLPPIDVSLETKTPGSASSGDVTTVEALAAGGGALSSSEDGDGQRKESQTSTAEDSTMPLAWASHELVQLLCVRACLQACWTARPARFA